MAEYIYAPTPTSNNNFGLSYNPSIGVAEINEATLQNIPSNAEITKVILSFDAKQSLGSSKGDLDVCFIHTEVSNTVKSFYSKDDVVTNSYNNFSIDITSGFYLAGSNVGQVNVEATHLTIEFFAVVARRWYFQNRKITFTYYIPTYTLTVNATAGGTVTGGGTYESGETVTLTATPKKGYRFVKWSDGNTSATRTVTVTANVTYTAEFTKNVYVTYDSIFSFAKWKDTGITAGNGAVSDITNIGFALTSNAGVSEATCSSHYFPVEYGKSYKIDIDIVGTNWDVYIFFCDKDGNWIDFADSSNRFSSNGGGVSSRVFTAPNKSSVVKAQIRVDANGGNNKVLFSNFRIFPAEYEYFSNTVSAEERDDVNAWSQPTPTRQGWKFFAWCSTPTGGDAYTKYDDFPTEDMTLYSYWESTKPEILSVQILYNGSQVSLSNKIIAGQGYIIGVTIK